MMAIRATNKRSGLQLLRRLALRFGAPGAVLLILLLSGCAQATPTPFIPPSDPVQTANTPQPGLENTPTNAPTAALLIPSCTSGLTFLEDLTIPDGQQVDPGQELDKQWLVRNSGTCNWDADYRLRLIAGDGMGSPAEMALFPARSGTEASLLVALTAPAEGGVYRSAWQAFDPAGNPFGDPVFIEISVQTP